MKDPMASSNNTAFQSGISYNKPPLFDGSNYSHWKYRMEIHLKSIGYNLWEIINNGPIIPLTKNDKNEDVAKDPADYSKEDKINITQTNKALSILLCSLSAREHSRVTGLRNPHEVWKKLEVTHEGTS